MAKLFSRRPQKDAIARAEEASKLRRPFQTLMAEGTGSSVGFMAPGTNIRQSLIAPSQQISPAVAPEYTPTDYSQLIEEAPGFELPPQARTEPQSGQNIFNFIDRIIQQNTPQPIGSSSDGGVILGDQSTLYRDGSIKTPQGETIYPVASVPGGKLKYSNGEIYSQGGLTSLVRMIFGKDQAITQAYGNINPIEPTRGNVNLGTDIRTRDLYGSQRNIELPFDVRVVQVLNDDGTRFGAKSGHMGYGNSVLVALPTGEMLRLSHLSSKGDFQQGDTIPAWTTIGTPGTTGNTYGEHLDLEYYNAEGKIDNPENFRAPVEMIKPIKDSQAQGQVLGATDSLDLRRTSIQQPVQQPLQTPTPPRPAIDPESFVSPQAPRPELGTAVNQVGRDIGLPKEGFLGIGEAVAGDMPAAREEQRRTVERLPFNEMLGSSERSREQDTNVFRQFGGDLIDLFNQKLQEHGIKLPEFNVSEAIAGGKTMLSEGAKNLVPKAQASEPLQSTMTEPPRSGQGLSALRGQVLGTMGVSSRPAGSDISERKAVGDIAGAPQSLMSTAPTETTQQQGAKEQTDIRDPFFRTGLDKLFSPLMQNTQEKRALSTDLFKPEFYQNTERINKAFGGTSLMPEAQGKYESQKQQMLEQYKQRYGGDQYDQGDLQRILSSLPTNVDLSKVSLPAPAKKMQLEYQDAAQSAQPSQSQPLFQGSSYTKESGSQPVSQKSMATLKSVATQVPKNAPAPPAAKFQLETPKVAGASASTKQAPQSSSNVFQKAISYITSLFRR